MANAPESDSSASFVFALGTTPAQAMRIREVAANLAPGTSLRARREDEWHYGHTFGFEYADMDSSEPVQAGLKRISNERDARLRTTIAPGAPYVVHCIEPLPVVLIVLGAVGAGIAQEVGKDIWTGVKGGVARLWRRLRQQQDQPSTFARLYGDIARLHTDASMYPVVLLQLAQNRLTFVIEPGLTRKAIWQAENLIRRPEPNLLDVPLRWHQDRKQWLRVESAISSDQALRTLQRQINRLAQAELRRTVNREE